MSDTRIQFTPSSGITIDGEDFSIGVEIQNIGPSASPNSANVAIKSFPLPTGAKSITFQQISASVEPSDTQRARNTDVLFRIHLSDTQDKPGRCIQTIIVKAFPSAENVFSSGEYTKTIRDTDLFLVVEVGEASGAQKVDAEYQVIGKFNF